VSESRFLTVEEVASLCRASPWWVYAQARRGRLPCYRPAKRLLFLEHEVVAWIERECRRGPLDLPRVRQRRCAR